MADFPSLLVTPGQHLLGLVIDGHDITGAVDLLPYRPPTASLFTELNLELTTTADGTTFYPSDPRHFGTLAGRLTSGHDIVLGDASVHAWFPERLRMDARYALVGVDIRSRTSYDWIDLQMSGLDEFISTNPVKNLAWPGQPQHDSTFKAQLNPASNYEWHDDEIEVHCFYDYSFPLTSHSFGLSFAPIVHMASKYGGFDVDHWMSQWVTPLLELVSFSLGKPQSISWLTLGARQSDDAYVRCQLFGSGIGQQPYTASRPTPTSRGEIPLITLSRTPHSLIDTVRQWRSLSADEDPYFELLKAAQNKQLTTRVRFLYLVQALESMHATKNKVDDDEADDQFSQRREAALEEIVESDVSPETASFVKKKWSKRRPDSLERRLRALLNELPDEFERQCAVDVSDIRDEIHPDLQESHVTKQIQTIRNDLSHGKRSYPARLLARWVSALDLIAEAHVLLDLGYSHEATLTMCSRRWED